MAQADDIAAELERGLAMQAKKLVLDVTANLIATTPVDTGWARANWFPSVGSPVMVASGSPAAPPTGQQQAAMVDVLRYTLEQGDLWVANPVPYVVFLNYGTSSQQPSGFIERAIDKANAENTLTARIEP